MTDGERDRRKPKALVVHPNALTLLLTFEDEPGDFDIVSADLIHEAIDLVQNNRFDVVFLKLSVNFNLSEINAFIGRVNETHTPIMLESSSAYSVPDTLDDLFIVYNALDGFFDPGARQTFENLLRKGIEHYQKLLHGRAVWKGPPFPKIGFVTVENDVRFDNIINRMQLEGFPSDNILRLHLSDKSRIADIVKWSTAESLDIICFPLTLPKFLSIQIGEYSRSGGSSTKSLLISQSPDLKTQAVFGLFHGAVSRDDFSPSVIERVLANDVPLDRATVAAFISDFVRKTVKTIDMEALIHRKEYKILAMHTLSDYMIASSDLADLRREKREANLSEVDVLTGRKRRLVVFIHGLAGNSQKSWGNLPRFLNGKESSSDTEFAFYSYPSSLFGLPFFSKAPSIQELANGLRTTLKYKYKDFDDISLVCHSLGGIVGRKYITEEIKRGRNNSVSNLILFAVPNNGAEIASLKNILPWRQRQIAQLCVDSDILEDLNEDWFQFNVQNFVRTKYIIGAMDSVVDRFSAQGYWGNPDVETIVDRGHINIIKPQNPDDLSVRILRDFLKL